MTIFFISPNRRFLVFIPVLKQFPILCLNIQTLCIRIHLFYLFCRITRVVYHLSSHARIIAYTKRRHSMELHLYGISLDTSIVHICTEVDYHIYLFHMVHRCSDYSVGSSIAQLLSESVQIFAGAIYIYTPFY